jgi:hypothetical protein
MFHAKALWKKISKKIGSNKQINPENMARIERIKTGILATTSCVRYASKKENIPRHIGKALMMPFTISRSSHPALEMD